MKWKKIMNGKIVLGPDYWSNGHFLLKKRIISIPKSVLRLNLSHIYTDSSIYDIWGEDESTGTIIQGCKGCAKGHLIIYHGVQFDANYINVFKELIPDFSLRVRREKTSFGHCPSAIEVDNKLVGLLMPISGGEWQ